MIVYKVDHSQLTYVLLNNFSRFKELQSDVTGYNQALLQSLSPEQRTSIQTIIHYTEKRKQEKGKFQCF